MGQIDKIIKQEQEEHAKTVRRVAFVSMGALMSCGKKDKDIAMLEIAMFATHNEVSLEEFDNTLITTKPCVDAMTKLFIHADKLKTTVECHNFLDKAEKFFVENGKMPTVEDLA